MIRKQLYIDEEQERLLKRRSRELGISEAELARQALDHLLRQAENTGPSRRRRAAVEDWLTHNQELSWDLDAGSFRREDLYAERLGRW